MREVKFRAIPIDEFYAIIGQDCGIATDIRIIRGNWQPEMRAKKYGCSSKVNRLLPIFEIMFDVMLNGGRRVWRMEDAV